MPWITPKPQENWEDRETTRFLQDVFTRVVFGTFALTCGAIGAGATVDTTVTLATGTGLRAGMAVDVSPPVVPLLAGLVVGGVWCAATDQITVRIGNITGGALTPVTDTWSFKGITV